VDVPLPLGCWTAPALATSFSFLTTATLTWLNSESKLCYDWRSVDQSVLVSSTHLVLKPQIFISVRQLRVSWCGVPSVMKEWVCCLQLLLAFASAVILGSKSCETHDHILLSQVWDSPNLEGQFPVFISPTNRVAQALGSLFLASYDSRGSGGGICPHLHTGYLTQLNC
jgi:hypothetical protein